jgi:mannose-1-phosphate guanylyltransferase
MLKIKPVIMAGGKGKRLWPLSNQSYPKQFTSFYNEYSLLQNTLIRNQKLGNPTVIINEEHYEIASKQAKEIGIEATFIIEPYGRNTAPCSILAGLLAQEEGFDYIALLPADHYISDNSQYLQTIYNALQYADNSVVLLGILPGSPHTGYGYIEQGIEINAGVNEVNSFIEKPTFLEAQKYIARKTYYWNSGIFVYSYKYFFEQAKTLQPEMFNLVSESFYRAKRSNDKIELLSDLYYKVPSLPFDKAILENRLNRIVIKGTFEWHDVGNFDSLWRVSQKDSDNNFLDCNVVANKVTNSYVITREKKPTTIIGLDNVVVINTEQGLLIANKANLEDLTLMSHAMSNGEK